MRARSKGAAFWKKHMESVAGSGLSTSEYCKKHGLKTPAFYRWRHRLKADTLKARPRTGQLVPVEIVDTRRGSLETSFRVVLPAHGAVEIRGDFGAVTKVLQLMRWESV